MSQKGVGTVDRERIGLIEDSIQKNVRVVRKGDLNMGRKHGREMGISNEMFIKCTAREDNKEGSQQLFGIPPMEKGVC